MLVCMLKSSQSSDLIIYKSHVLVAVLTIKALKVVGDELIPSRLSILRALTLGSVYCEFSKVK